MKVPSVLTCAMAMATCGVHVSGEERDWIGIDITSTPDVSGDDVEDLLVALPLERGEGTAGLAWISAREMKLLAQYRIHPEAGAKKVGACVVRDQNQDSIPDIVLRSLSSNGEVAIQLLSGSDWSLLAERVILPAHEDFGEAMYALHSDRGDLVLATYRTSDAGSGFLSFKLPELSLNYRIDAQDRFGDASVSSGVDVDSDGVADFAVGSPAGPLELQGLAIIYSGATGAELARFHGDTAGFGSDVLLLDSWGAERTPALAVAQPSKDGENALCVYDLAQQVLDTRIPGDDYDSSEISLSKTADLDGDTVDDLLLGFPMGWRGGGPMGSVKVISSAKRAETRTLGTLLVAARLGVRTLSLRSGNGGPILILATGSRRRIHCLMAVDGASGATKSHDVLRSCGISKIEKTIPLRVP